MGKMLKYQKESYRSKKTEKPESFQLRSKKQHSTEEARLTKLKKNTRNELKKNNAQPTNITIQERRIEQRLTFIVRLKKFGMTRTSAEEERSKRRDGATLTKLKKNNARRWSDVRRTTFRRRSNSRRVHSNTCKESEEKIV